MKELKNYTPTYIEGDPEKWMDYLEEYLSKGEIKRLIKQGGLKIGKIHLDEVWVKIGKGTFLIIRKKYCEVAVAAQIYWEYHFELMSKKIEWKAVE